jgi:FKBP-type peptidyl-prolyl cis-trans isomerase
MLSFISCKDKVDNYLEEQKILAKYIADSSITTTPTSSGLYYIEILKGNGIRSFSGAEVSVRYKGYFLDGTVFDSNLDADVPYTFVLGYSSVINGWHEGVSYMNDGGKAKLIVPSSLAYGAQGSYDEIKKEYKIPPYTTLIFEIEIVNIQ